MKGLDQPQRVTVEEYLANEARDPDVSVAYQKPEYLISPGGFDALMNPSIVVEVVNEGTEDYDRGEKFEYYRTLPSLEQYVVANSLKKEIETFTRQDEKHWLMTTAREPDEKVKIGSCEFTVGEIYRKVFLE